LIGIGIALHNFPEGLAIGVGFTSFQNFGVGLSLIIALHDIPEGIAMATPMRMGGINPIKIVLAALLAGVPTGIGALMGYLTGGNLHELYRFVPWFCWGCHAVYYMQ
jgi:ZIP family zinc transporter